jgi:hypothetical protein
LLWRELGPCGEAGGFAGALARLDHKSDEKEWGERIASLVVGREGSDTAANGTWETVGTIGVDSRQAGVFGLSTLMMRPWFRLTTSGSNR